MTPPGMRPLSMSFSSAAPIRASRCDDMPTLSGVALGNCSAPSRATGALSAAMQIAARERTIRRFMRASGGRLDAGSLLKSIEHGRQATDVIERDQPLDAGPRAVAEILS